MAVTSRKPKEKPRVSIIGAGRLGTALAIALSSRGYPIQALVARHLGHALKSRRRISSRPIALAGDQLEMLPHSDLLIIATPDDAIESVVSNLANVEGGPTSIPGIVLHTSGALSSEVLKPLRASGCHTGSLHPLVSVSDSIEGSAAFASAFFCVEGDGVAIRLARQIVRDLGGKSFSIEAHHKALYHAAAVMSSGHMTALFDVAVELLIKSGLEDAKAQKVLLPLLESTWRNLTIFRPSQALTGTYARGDEATVVKHLSALAKAKQRDALGIYQLLGRRSLRLLAERGGDPKIIDRIEALLNDNSKRVRSNRLK